MENRPADGETMGGEPVREWCSVSSPQNRSADGDLQRSHRVLHPARLPTASTSYRKRHVVADSAHLRHHNHRARISRRLH